MSIMLPIVRFNGIIFQIHRFCVNRVSHIREVLFLLVEVQPALLEDAVALTEVAARRQSLAPEDHTASLGV